MSAHASTSANAVHGASALAKAFHVVQRHGVLVEFTRDGRRVIECPTCMCDWRRGRHAGRGATIADRATATRHVLTEHAELLASKLTWADRQFHAPLARVGVPA